MVVDASFCLSPIPGADQMAEALLSAKNLHFLIDADGTPLLVVNTADWQVK